ncbi:tudor domain-containing 6-like isoform X2 [Clinocottus analis]|uniref:tudor domain-containing 6-like isoform X2 n=1 Tax=Clinocottus analis TaxID=304258 RepID=UPI0035BFBE45
MCSIPGLPTPGSEVPVVITRVNLNSNCGLVELWVNMDDGRKPVYEQMREDIQIPKRRFSGSEGKPEDLCLVCISDTWHRARMVSIQVFSKAMKILSEQMQQHYEESSDLGEAQPLTRGAPYAARGINGRWHRSLLKETITSDGAVEVFHVDEGKIEFVPVGDIRPLHGKFLRMPVVTYPCSLEGVKDNCTVWTTGQNDYLKSLLLNKKLVAKFKQQNLSLNAYHVILYADDDACVNDCFTKMVGPFSSGQDTNVHNGPIPSLFLSSPGKKCCTDLQNKATVNVDGLREETFPCTKNQAVNNRTDGLATSGVDDAHIKESSEHPDPKIYINGHLLTGFPAELQNACNNEMLNVGSSDNVKVSLIESQQKFWCQPPENCDSLRHLMQDLQNHYASTHPPLLVESIFVVRNQDDNMWYRSRIVTSHHSPVVDVRFIDYGQTHTVPLQDVYPIDPAFLPLSSQAFQCCLFNCKNSTHPTSITRTDNTEFQQSVDVATSSNIGLKCTVKAVTSDEEGLLLKVVDNKTPPDGVCKLPTQEFAQAQALQILPQVPSDVYNCSTYDLEVDAKENVWITHSETVNLFYCQLDRNLNLFYKVMGSIEQRLNQPQSTDGPFELDSICFAKFTDNQWHRGQVVEMSPKIKVYFVDYGHTLSVNESDICPIPTEASVARSVPVQAIPLGLFGVPTEVPQEVNKWFADSAIGQMFTMSVVAKGENGKLLVDLFAGALDLNMKVREMMSKITQETTDQQLSNSSEHDCVPNKDCLNQELTNVSVLTMMKDLKLHSNNEPCARDEPSPQSITNTYAQEFEHEKTVDELKKTSDFMDKEMEDGQSDSETSQRSLSSSPEGIVNVCIYKWPKISQNRIEEVYTSCIAGPHHCWCQYANTEDLNIVSRLAQEAGQVQQDKMFPETLGPGSPCLAQFSSDQQWYRAQVICRVNDAFRVLFIDYGNESEADVKNVRSLSQSLLEKAPQAFLCCLNGFDESKGSWNDDVYDDFYNLLVNKPLKLTVFNMNNHSKAAVPQYAVEIECEGVIVNAAILKYWNPVVEELIPIDPPEKETFLQNIQTESNMTQANVCKVNVNAWMYKKPNFSKNKKEEVYASCIVHPHYFWCQYDNPEELSKVSELAQEEGKLAQDKMFPETLGPGSPCLALFSSDEQWYRAQVIRRIDNTFSVLFIDYGNESDVDIKNVRSLSQSLLEKTPQAFLCSLKGFDESNGSWNADVYDDFYNLLVDKPLKLTVFNMDDHSKTEVPQYAVEIECDGKIVNAAMQKYWKPVAERCVSIENPEEETLQDIQTESSMTHLDVSKVNVNACMYKKPNLSKNKKEEVYASCIVHPHYFWCQYDNPEELSKVSELAQEEGKMAQDKMFPETLGPGSPCLALFSSDKQWYRAQVIRRIADTFSVLFIDYGNESDVDIKNVRSLSQSLLEKTPLSFLCSLKGFDESNGSWNAEVYDDFYNLLVDKPLKLTVFNMDDHSKTEVPQYAVEIECEGAIVNAAMLKYWKPVTEGCVSMEHPKEETVQDIQTESSMTHFNVSKVNVNACMYKKPNFSKNKKEEVYASCIVHPHYFWCQYDNPEELSKVSELAQEEGKMAQDKMFPETLGPGSPCLALFSSDEQWYRAQVIRRIDNTFSVLFIDYGNESDVDVKNVRSVSQSLLEKTPQAFLCSLKGFDETKGSWNDEIYDDFYNLLVDKPLKLTVFNMDDYSEAAVPQYKVEIECEGSIVNALMEKYWKGLDTDHALEDHLGSG